MKAEELDHLDLTLRGLHSAATRQISPATLGRIREARHGLGNQSHRNPAPGAWRWVAAGFGSIALALGIGLQLAPLAPEAVAPPTPLATTSASASDYPASLAALDEDPDLYLWLASEAGPLQLEQF